MKNEIEYIYPATSLQQGFIYHDLHHSEDDAYRVQVLFDYDEALDISLYLRAWECCIEQYPILRTAFNWEEDIIQIIYKYGKLDYQLHDVSNVNSQDERDAMIEEIQVKDRMQGFDLDQPTLFRLHIIKQKEDCYTVLRSVHHSISDGWSEPVLLSSLHKYYKEFKNKQTPQIKQDTAYLEAQEYISKHKSTIQEYWKTTLAEVDGGNDINALLSRPIDLVSYKHIEHSAESSFEISSDSYHKLKAFINKEGITTNVIVQFIWHKLLQIYSNSLKSIVGTTVSGRNIPVDGIEESVGLYINTLPLIVSWDNDNSVNFQLHQIQKQISELNTHSFADLAKLQKGGERIFHSLFVFENYPELKEEKEDLKIRIRKSIEKVDYPLSILAYEYDAKLVITLQYDAHYLDKEKSQEHLVAMESVIHQMIENPNQSHNRISLLQPQEYDKLIYGWNATKEYPMDKTIYQLFEEQVKINPDHIALVYEGEELTYKELNEKSNQLARTIRKKYKEKTGKKLSPDTLIALYLDRSFEMVIGILAVLKSGGAYVPMDTTYPQERIDYLLEDTGAELILSQRYLIGGEHQTKLPNEKIICIDLLEEFYNEEDKTNLENISNANDLAYVIYTSGTTGNPKGVMQMHCNVMRLFTSTDNQFDFNASDVWTLFHSYAFDFSVWELWGALLYGGKLLIISKEQTRDIEHFYNLCVEARVTVLNQTPSIFYRFADIVGKSGQSNLNLRYVIFGGEALNCNQLGNWWNFQIKNKLTTKLINMYGITETTVHVTYKEITKEEVIQSNIGKPIADLKSYVLDSGMSPVPIGVIGELYIGGAGLARGYLNRQDLTQERFIPNLYATVDDEIKGYTRLYKTGDLVRWLSDGNLEYIGRNDDQVKIRGYRIELGEIEYALTQIEGIKEVCVLVKEKKSDAGTTKYLVCYYVLDVNAKALSPSIILEQLTKLLPEYMVPAALVSLESFPLTVNGKLDKRALPDPVFGTTEKEHVAPANETEQSLCSIWKEVLGLDKVSVNDNFFRIGGDSILSIQVSSRIRQAGFSCQVKDIFDHKTISKLAEHLNKKKTEVSLQTEQGILRGELGLLPIQEWFIGKVNKKEFVASDYFNQSFLMKVPVLEINKLEKIINALVSYHDVLRISYVKEIDKKTNEVRWTQFYNEQIELPELKVLDVSKYDEAEIHSILSRWQSGFNLEEGPLFQTGYLFGYEDGSARIYFALHHMIVDAVSWRILTEDVKTLYEGKALPAKGSSYRQWVSSIEAYSKQHASEKNYWKEQLKGMPSYQIESQEVELFESHCELDKDLTRSLLQEASNAYHTEVNDLLLTALAYALRDINGNDIQGITLEGHGREDIDQSIDHSHTLGWFTTIFPVKLEIKDNLKESIQCIKDNLRSIPNKGIGFGFFATKNETDYTFDDLAPISFNYLGQFETQQGDWQVVSEDSGDNSHETNSGHYLININGMISNGKLGFSIVTKLGDYITNRLGDNLITHLTQIIKHCTVKFSHGGTSYSEGDFYNIEHEGDLSNLPLVKNVARMFESFPMTDIQKSYLLGRLDAFEIGGVSNHTYNEFKFMSPLDIRKLEKCINLLIDIYPELRTVFDTETLTQRYLDPEKIEIYKVSMETFHCALNEDLLLPKRASLSHHVYDASSYPLFTFFVSRFDDCDMLHFSIDLILLDAESRESFFTKLTELYQDPNAVLTPPKFNFKDYQDYVSLLKHSKWYSTDKKYWNNKIEALPLRPELLLNCNPKTLENPRFEMSTRIVERESWKSFKSKSNSCGISASAALLSLFGYVLSKYSTTKDFLITLTVFSRYAIHPDVNSVWGDFTSTNLFGYKNVKGSIKDKLLSTHTDLWNDLNHGLYNGIEVLRELQSTHQLDPYQAVSPVVFTSKVGGDNINEIGKMDTPSQYFLDKSEDTASGLWIGQTSQAWIDLQALEDDGQFISTWMYVAQLFDKDLIEKFNADYCRLIEYLANADWESPMPEIQLPEVDSAVIEKANNYNQEEVSETLVDICLKGIAANPNRIAVVDSSGSFTYKVIGEYSNAIARYLYAHGLSKRNHLVGVLSGKGYEQVVSTLGIMLSGAAYLPLHVDWPTGRIDEVLTEGRVKTVLISQRVFNESIAGSEIKSKYQWLIVEEVLKCHPDTINTNLPTVHLEDLAYVIFTSGSTGKPKGVIIDHMGAVNTIHAVNAQFNVSKEDKVLALSELSFDLSVYDIFGLLAVGGTIVFPDKEDSKQPEHWHNLVTDHKITLWNTVPQLMQLLVDYVNDNNKKIDSLRVVMMSGDWIPVKLPDAIKLLNRNTAIMSLGGATEGSIWSVWYDVKEIKSGWNSIPYGHAMPNQKMYVLNEFLEHCPLGVKGDIYIGGQGVALGYWNDEAKTNGSFIQHDKLGRLYRTGDLGKWNREGYMEFEGRKDSQVKINGYRVELDEISSKLNKIDGVDKSLVVVQNNQLIAYLVEENAQTSITKEAKESPVTGLLKEIDAFLDMSNRTDEKEDAQLENDLNRLYEFAILKLFNGLQIFTKAGSKFSASAIIASTGIISSYEKFIHRALLNLSDLGHLVKVEGNDKQFYNQNPLPLADQAFFDGLKLPEEFKMIGHSAFHLKEILTENLSAEIYEESFSTDVYKEGLKHERQFMEKIFKQISAVGAGSLTILEVGAGTGSLADVILDNIGEDDKYVFTDISRHFLVDIKNKYPNKKNLICELYNLDEDPHNLGVGKYQYDVILAHGVLHDVKSINQTMDYLAEVMKPEGVIIIVEPTVFHNYVDISHGYITGFDNFEDYDLRPSHPYLSVKQWDEILHAKGFEKVLISEDGDMMTALYSFKKAHKYFLDMDLLRQHISRSLPEYMRPQHYVKLKQLPLSANGKVDITKLPKPDMLENDYIAPTTELEIEICKIWEEAMGLDRVGINDNFFKVGGNSILAIRTSHRMSKVLGRDVKVADLFRNPTVSKLVSKLGSKIEYEEGKL